MEASDFEGSEFPPPDMDKVRRFTVAVSKMAEHEYKLDVPNMILALATLLSGTLATQTSDREAGLQAAVNLMRHEWAQWDKVKRRREEGGDVKTTKKFDIIQQRW